MAADPDQMTEEDYITGLSVLTERVMIKALMEKNGGHTNVWEVRGWCIEFTNTLPDDEMTFEEYAELLVRWLPGKGAPKTAVEAAKLFAEE